MTDSEWLNKQRKTILSHGQTFTPTKNNNMNKSVYQLRKEGYKVRISHSRYVLSYDGEDVKFELVPIKEIKEKEGNLKSVWSKGGFTKIEVDTPDGQNIVGTAQCNLSDSFCRSLALKIALGRAFKNLK